MTNQTMTNAEQAQHLMDEIQRLDNERAVLSTRLLTLRQEMGYPYADQITRAAREKKAIRRGCIEP